MKHSIVKIKALSKEVNKEPVNMLIDNRFDNVKDWKKVENNSSKLSINKKPSKEDRKINNQSEHINIPKHIKYNIKLINTAIMPKI